MPMGISVARVLKQREANIEKAFITSFQLGWPRFATPNPAQAQPRLNVSVRGQMFTGVLVTEKYGQIFIRVGARNSERGHHNYWRGTVSTWK